MEVQIISREIISPLTPTNPHRLSSLKLSSLDHLATSNYVTIILFYPSDCDVENQEDHIFKRSDQLKRSLSETLTHFYPVAGRIRDGFTAVDCVDQGVEFLEAKANTRLAEFLKQPDIDDLDKLLPCAPCVTNEELLSKALLAIQATYFDCGGMALGICFSHKIADGASMSTFIKFWADAANGSSGTAILPNLSFNLPSVFPAKDSDGSGPSGGGGMGGSNIVTRRFIFDSEKIAAIRGAIAAKTGNGVERPTRVEAVSAFIWEHAITAVRGKAGPERASIAIHAVNLRGRMVPPLPSYTFGNASRPTITQCVALESDTTFHVLVKHLRDAMKRIDGDYVRKLQCGEEGFMNSIEETKKQVSTGEVLAMNFNSWCRFPFYEADFGWGNPIWVSTTKTPGKNLVILIDCRFGDGIEAWLNMLEEDMVELEKDEKFLSFVST